METFPVRDELRVLLRGGSAEPGWATDTTLVEDADRAHLLSTLDLALEEVIADQPAEIARPIVLRRLAQRHERAAYEDTLARVVEALDDAGIRFLLLKGLANESRWYRPGERRMSDIDVVVHRDDLGRLPEVAARLSPDTATVEPGISADDASYNRLEGAQRRRWLDLLFEVRNNPTTIGASRHLLYVGRK